MSSQLVSTTAALPASAGTAAMPAGANGSGSAAGSDQTAVVALLQHLVSVVSQLVAIVAAQNGAQSVQGGGGATLQQGEQVVELEALRSAVAGTVIGGKDVLELSWGHVVSSSGGGIAGGGPGAVQGAVTPVSAVELLGNASLGGSFDVGYSIYGSGGSSGAPAAAGAAAVGGGGAATVDMRRVLGTPQPGGILDQLIQRASTTAMPSRSEGTWLVLTDGAGARMQVHVHGALAGAPDRIADAVARGQLVVHLHEDGTIHLHDVA